MSEDTKTLTPEQIAEGWVLHDGSDIIPVPAGWGYQVVSDLKYIRSGGGPIMFMSNLWDFTKALAYRLFSPVVPRSPSQPIQEERGVETPDQLSDRLLNSCQRMHIDGSYWVKLSDVVAANPSRGTVSSDAWPSGCLHPNSCDRHGTCMYVGCTHQGKALKSS